MPPKFLLGILRLERYFKNPSSNRVGSLLSHEWLRCKFETSRGSTCLLTAKVVLKSSAIMKIWGSALLVCAAVCVDHLLKGGTQARV